MTNALFTLNDVLPQAWVGDSCTSFHVTPIKECFATFHASDHGHVYLQNNHACSIEGIDTMHHTIDGTNELVLHDVSMYQASRKVYCLFDKWICMDIVTSLRKGLLG